MGTRRRTEPDLSMSNLLCGRSAVLAQAIERGDDVSPHEVAAALTYDRTWQLSPVLLEYAAKMILGEIKVPAHRHKDDQFKIASDKFLAVITYRNTLAWLQRRPPRSKGYGFAKLPSDAKLRSMPPAEIAGRIAARRYWRGEGSWKTVKKMSSELPAFT